jgi:hypothetical protein
MPAMNQVRIALILCSILFLGAIISGCTSSAPTENEALISQILTPITIALQNNTIKTYLTGNLSINNVALNAQGTRSGGGGGQPEFTLNAPDVIIETDADYVHAFVDLQNNTVAGIWIQEKRTIPCC